MNTHPITKGKSSMKQSISKEQWNELSADNKMDLVGAMGWSSYDECSYVYWEFVTIGIMIEFLGDDCVNIDINYGNKYWYIDIWLNNTTVQKIKK